MTTFENFIQDLPHPEQQVRLTQLFDHIEENFPELERTVKWNQPMYTHHGTYIIGFSFSSKHLAIAPETAAILRFEDLINKSGYAFTHNIIKAPWDKTLDYGLLDELISFNIEDKASHTKFWR